MWTLAGETLTSRLMLGTARYPSPELVQKSIERSGTQVITVSLRRQTSGDASRFWDTLKALPVRILPNTAHCYSVEEAVTTAKMAREVFKTPWIKLEVLGDKYTLQPDPFGLVEAAKILISDGFEVFPYTTDDLVVAERLVSLGCRILMPWGAPIGSGQGLSNLAALKLLRARFPDTTLIVDAGIGAPSHAAAAMEIGFDGVLLNSAVAGAENPPMMAHAFAQAIEAGRMGYEAGLIPPQSFARASTPITGKAFSQESA